MRRPLRIFPRWPAAAGCTAALAFAATPAHADPITAAIFGAAFAATTAGAVTTFLITTAITTGLSAISQALFGPKTTKAPGQERQADVLNLSIGEVSREWVVGRTAVAGSLVDCAYFGGQYGTTTNLFVIALADHECDALEGVYVNDVYVPWPYAQGNYGGELPGYNNQLHVHFRPGAPGGDAGHPQAFMDALDCCKPGALKGVCHVSVAYDADAPDAANPTWSGRPSFLFVLRAAKLYDPRKDSTVAVGSGPHRWADVSTREWSRNAALAEYNYQRGIYALGLVDQPGQLLIGRGLSAAEAPPERVIAAANLCDEDAVHNVVDGGEVMEPRYAVDGVIKASDTFQAVAQMFADATAGVITQPEGGVFVEPGAAKTPALTITDADLLIGQPVRMSGFVGESDRINTVIARYIEPGQKYAETAAPVVRNADDVAEDGGPRELTLTLPLVTSATQAQRIAIIRRNKARLERTAAIVLGPRFAHLEEGDWIGWHSARYFSNATVYFRITAYGLDEAWRNTLALEEIDFDVYGFGGGGADPTAPAPVDAPDALALQGVQLQATHLPGDDGSILPAVEGRWTTPVDPAISTVRLEVRVGADGMPTPTSTTNVSKGELLATNGVAAGITNLQARLVPLGPPGRPITPSAWVTLSTVDLVASSAGKVGGKTVAQIIDDARTEVAGELAQLEALQTQADSLRDQALALLHAVDALGIVQPTEQLELIARALDAKDAAILQDFRTRSPTTGEPLNAVVDRHTEDLGDHTTTFALIGRRSVDGQGFVLDFSTTRISETQTLSQHIEQVSAQRADDALAVVAINYLAVADVAYTLATYDLTLNTTFANTKSDLQDLQEAYSDPTTGVAHRLEVTEAQINGDGTPAHPSLSARITTAQTAAVTAGENAASVASRATELEATVDGVPGTPGLSARVTETETAYADLSGQVYASFAFRAVADGAGGMKAAGIRAFAADGTEITASLLELEADKTVIKASGGQSARFIFDAVKNLFYADGIIVGHLVADSVDVTNLTVNSVNGSKIIDGSASASAVGIEAFSTSLAHQAGSYAGSTAGVAFKPFDSFDVDFLVRLDNQNNFAATGNRASIGWKVYRNVPGVTAVLVDSDTFKVEAGPYTSSYPIRVFDQPGGPGTSVIYSLVLFIDDAPSYNSTPVVLTRTRSIYRVLRK